MPTRAGLPRIGVAFVAVVVSAVGRGIYFQILRGMGGNRKRRDNIPVPRTSANKLGSRRRWLPSNERQQQMHYELDNLPAMMPLHVAAKALNRSYQTTHKYCWRGLKLKNGETLYLDSVLINGQRLIPVTALRDFLQKQLDNQHDIRRPAVVSETSAAGNEMNREILPTGSPQRQAD